jgi:hypothetical protein
MSTPVNCWRKVSLEFRSRYFFEHSEERQIILQKLHTR